MPELRHDPLSGQWVVIAPERAARPDTFRTHAPPSPDGPSQDCPFCPGNESMTPPEVARAGGGPADGPGWRVRVVPNLYPIVTGPPPAHTPSGIRFHEAVRATGAHEVVVLSPDHHRSLADLAGPELEEVFAVLMGRTTAHLDAGHEYVQILVNHGKEAGASIEHPHLQLMAIDLPPPTVVTEAHHISVTRECPVCRGVQEDADPGSPFLVSGGASPVWCPWWSGVPFEVMIAPRSHLPRVEQSGEAVGDVARALGRALSLLRDVVGDAPYNLVVHTSPSPNTADFHWHVHIWPRLSIQAGFEQGTGIFVNLMPPEQAAEQLRGAGVRAST